MIIKFLIKTKKCGLVVFNGLHKELNYAVN